MKRATRRFSGSCFKGAVGDQAPVIEALIVAGADPDAVTEAGDANCVMFAAQSGSETAVTALLNGGGLIDGSADGVTALMVAARAGNKAIVELLLRMGADPSIKCRAYTAADYARYGGNDELADLISNAKPRRQTDIERCMICGQRLNIEGDPMSADTGGDCWGCVGKIEADMGSEMSIRFVDEEIRKGWRLPDGTPKSEHS